MGLGSVNLVRISDYIIGSCERKEMHMVAFISPVCGFGLLDVRDVGQLIGRLGCKYLG